MVSEEKAIPANSSGAAALVLVEELFDLLIETGVLSKHEVQTRLQRIVTTRLQSPAGEDPLNEQVGSLVDHIRVSLLGAGSRSR
jgi:hypothetical protein